MRNMIYSPHAANVIDAEAKTGQSIITMNNEQDKYRSGPVEPLLLIWLCWLGVTSAEALTPARTSCYRR